MSEIIEMRFCSFCGYRHSGEMLIVTGRQDVAACEDCILLMAEVMLEKRPQKIKEWSESIIEKTKVEFEKMKAITKDD